MSARCPLRRVLNLSVQRRDLHRIRLLLTCLFQRLEFPRPVGHKRPDFALQRPHDLEAGFDLLLVELVGEGVAPIPIRRHVTIDVCYRLLRRLTRQFELPCLVGNLDHSPAYTASGDARGAVASRYNYRWRDADRPSFR